MALCHPYVSDLTLAHSNTPPAVSNSQQKFLSLGPSYPFSFLHINKEVKRPPKRYQAGLSTHIRVLYKETEERKERHFFIGLSTFIYLFIPELFTLSSPQFIPALGWKK